MYYEEKVIAGVLCWRGTPAGEWTAKTAQQLTVMLIEARAISAFTMPTPSPCPPTTVMPQPAFVHVPDWNGWNPQC